MRVTCHRFLFALFWNDADGLTAEVLGRTLDELSPQARRLLILLHDMVSQ